MPVRVLQGLWRLEGVEGRGVGSSDQSSPPEGEPPSGVSEEEENRGDGGGGKGVGRRGGEKKEKVVELQTQTTRLPYHTAIRVAASPLSPVGED